MARIDTQPGGFFLHYRDSVEFAFAL